MMGVPENHEDLYHGLILVDPEIDKELAGLLRWWRAKR